MRNEMEKERKSLKGVLSSSHHCRQQELTPENKLWEPG